VVRVAGGLVVAGICIHVYIYDYLDRVQTGALEIIHDAEACVIVNNRREHIIAIRM